MIKTVKERTKFPYIPGLLAFREAPSMLRAVRSLRARSYVCLVDAHGLAHPRRFGLACYVGLALDRPTIGVASERLSTDCVASLDRTGKDGNDTSGKAGTTLEQTHSSGSLQHCDKAGRSARKRS